MQLDELKSEVRNLRPEERRKLALYIFELEKDHLQATVGPQIADDIEGVSRAIQDVADKIRNAIKGS